MLLVKYVALQTRKLPVPLKGMIFWKWATYFINIYLDLILKEKPDPTQQNLVFIYVYRRAKGIWH